MKPKSHRSRHFSSTHLAQILCSQNKQVTPLHIPIQHDRQKYTIILVLAVGISDKDRLPWGMPLALPEYGVLGGVVEFGNAVHERGFQAVGTAVCVPMATRQVGWVYGWEFDGDGLVC